MFDDKDQQFHCHQYKEALQQLHQQSIGLDSRCRTEREMASHTIRGCVQIRIGYRS